MSASVVLLAAAFTFIISNSQYKKCKEAANIAYTVIFSPFLSEDMDQGGGVLELHTQELKMPHAMIMQDFGKW